ncbi:hypothetical protein AU196_22365 [Mycobacterium sp. IS-1742]|uniref:DUF6777 domain-containing protein n=1 Tax=Mycobacterium sp. IS-1742 TaxID=1772285 RepID=UPI0007402C86|nr:DUF6777 domain-containing protein [Mycobacterium sp. IS-1742]KUI25564.1 hypothetical protein AU196_22365 [Mycobacterium sp. IS-1742]
MTHPQTDWADPDPPGTRDPRTTAILAVSGALLTALVVATLIGVVLFSAGDDSDRTAGEAVLIAANTPTVDTFTRSILVAPVTISDQTAAQTVELLEQIPVRADRGVRVVSGRQPGLYGATGQTTPCDAVTLANDLDADPDTARVWGLALGITPQQIPHYLNTLTAVVLLSDTWVTTHTPAEDAPDPKQAVLQAGSAVLIDPLGVPRVRCASGAPLAPPDSGTLTHYRLDGEQWPAFSPQTVVAVKYAATDNSGAAREFTLTDAGTGQQIVQRAGGVIDLGGTSVPLPDPVVMNIPPNRPESRNR